MILETSALVALLTGEAEARSLSTRLGRARRVVVPAHVVLEASMVMWRLKRDGGQAALDAYLGALRATVLPFTAAHAEAAREAFARYGKGRHPAALNFGDCMSYGVAKVEGMALLWVGGDFGRTDVVAVQ